METTPLDGFRTLGTPDQVMAHAPAQLDASSLGIVNAHLHLPPNFSAFETIRQAMEQAANEQVWVVGVNNYYGFDIYTEFAVRSALARVVPLFGMEVICMLDDLRSAGTLLNDPANPGKLYLCGKALHKIAPMNSRATAVMQRIRQLDSTRVDGMLAKLSEVARQRDVNVVLNPDSVKRDVARRHGCPSELVYLQERHAARALQEAVAAAYQGTAYGSAMSRLLADPTLATAAPDPIRAQDLIRSALMKAGKPAYVEETFVDYASAREMILNLGGIPCYPLLLDGAKTISGFEQTPEALIANLKKMNIHAVEFITFRNSAALLETYTKALRAAGFIVTAGTEHNTLDAMPIEPRGPKGAEIAPDVRNILTEGACVLVAHQFLGLHGIAGWVDEHGDRTDAGKPDDRIAELARIGAAVIHRYRTLAAA